MLALHVKWHMRQALAPVLFEDDDREGAWAVRASLVETSRVSARAKARADSQCTEDGLPVHSLRTLIDDLTTLTLNEVSFPGEPDAIMPMLSEPTRM